MKHKYDYVFTERKGKGWAIMRMHVCMHVPTASLPYLKSVWVCATCPSVCAATISLIHALCVCVRLYMYVRVSWCLYTQCWGPVQQQAFDFCQSAVIYIDSRKHNHTHSTLSLKYRTLYVRNVRTHSSFESPAKMPCGRTDNWLPNKLRNLNRGETES